MKTFMTYAILFQFQLNKPVTFNKQDFFFIFHTVSSHHRKTSLSALTEKLASLALPHKNPFLSSARLSLSEFSFSLSCKKVVAFLSSTSQHMTWLFFPISSLLRFDQNGSKELKAPVVECGKNIKKLFKKIVDQKSLCEK